MNPAPSQSARELPEMIVRRPAASVARIVVGVDGSVGSVAALRWAAAEACRCQVVLRIVSAWEEPGRLGSSHAGDPAQIAATRVQRALVRVLSGHAYPRHMACAAPKGAPGEGLLNEVSDADLLVLGATGVSAAQVPGSTGRYCLRHGPHDPVTFRGQADADDPAVVPVRCPLNQSCGLSAIYQLDGAVRPQQQIVGEIAHCGRPVCGMAFDRDEQLVLDMRQARGPGPDLRKRVRRQPGDLGFFRGRYAA